ncbi:hypothetical protein LK10_17250 [Sinomonas humi]|uniref:Uncharacterized protein n=2 Tax=Sinomonas humi TaxID=1338436 RepID=A0A0B2AGU1_9MICC|nr:hypothetical protein LK10_17250 [Sinomonas humi]
MKNSNTRTWTWYGLAATLVWIAALTVGAVAFVAASEAARARGQDATFLQEFLGAPLFEGFRQDGKFGVRPQWGLLLLVVVPLFATVLFTALRRRSP